MSEILSQEELGALLELVAGDPAPPPEAAVGRAAPRATRFRPTQADPYDFRRRSLLSPRELALLEGAMVRAARGLGSALSVLIRQPAASTPPTPSTMSTRAFLEALPRPCACFVIRLGLGEARALLAVDPVFVSTAVDLMLGGPGQVPAGREPTRTELALGRRLALAILAPLRAALREVAPVEAELERLETDPRVVDCIPAAEGLLVHEFAVDAGPLGGLVRLALPARALASALEAAAPHPTRRAAQEIEAGSPVRNLPVQAKVVLGETRLPVGTLMSLEVGDVLPLARRTNEPAELRLPGGRAMHGIAGIRGGRWSIKLVKG